MTTTLVSNELFSGCIFRLDVHSLQIIVHIAIYIYKMVILLLSSMLILTNSELDLPLLVAHIELLLIFHLAE